MLREKRQPVFFESLRKKAETGPIGPPWEWNDDGEQRILKLEKRPQIYQLAAATFRAEKRPAKVGPPLKMLRVHKPFSLWLGRRRSQYDWIWQKNHIDTLTFCQMLWTIPFTLALGTLLVNGKAAMVIGEQILQKRWKLESQIFAFEITLLSQKEPNLRNKSYG